MNSVFSCTRSQNRNGKLWALYTTHNWHNEQQKKTIITMMTTNKNNKKKIQKINSYLFKQLHNALYQRYNPTGIACRSATIKFSNERGKTSALQMKKKRLILESVFVIWYRFRERRHTKTHPHTTFYVSLKWTKVYVTFRSQIFKQKRMFTMYFLWEVDILCCFQKYVAKYLLSCTSQRFICIVDMWFSAVQF